MDLSPYIPWAALSRLRRAAKALSWGALGLLVALALMPDGGPPADADVLVTAVAPVLPKDNSYPALARLEAALKLSQEEQTRVTLSLDAPGKPAGLDAAFARNSEALRLLDSFRGRRFLPPEWADAAQLSYETPLPKLIPLTMSASLAIAQARWHAAHGRPAEALERLVRVAETGRSLQAHPVTLLSFAVGTNLRTRALKALRDLLAERPALPPALCREATRRLADDGRSGSGLSEALRMEYTIATRQIATLDPAAEDGRPGGNALKSWVAARFFKRNRTRALLLADFRAVLGDLEKPCPVERAVPAPPRFWSHPQFWLGNLVGVVLHAVGSPAFDMVLRRRCEERFWTEATRAALAARVFSAETGRAPASLAELSPRYLDAPPADPFGGGPLSLSADGVLSSAAVDGQGRPLAVRMRTIEKQAARAGPQKAP